MVWVSKATNRKQRGIISEVAGRLVALVLLAVLYALPLWMDGWEEDISEISELSLMKIGELMKCQDPPLWKALLIGLLLRRTTSGPHTDPDSDSEPSQESQQPAPVKGIIECISSSVGQSFPFSCSLNKKKPEDIEGNYDKLEEEDSGFYLTRLKPSDSSKQTVSTGLTCFPCEAWKCKKGVKYEELLGIRNVGIVAREVRFAEEEQMRKNWRKAQERGKRTISPMRGGKLKRDPSAELLKEIVNPTPVERLPPNRFMRSAIL